MTVLHLIVTLIAVSNYITFGYACKCAVRPPEYHFCNSGFIALVEIGARHADTERTVYYDITVKTIFKVQTASTQQSLLQNANKVWTNKDSAACGVQFEEGKQYVIGGQFGKEGRLSVSSCGYHQMWNDVKKEERDGLNGGYKC